MGIPILKEAYLVDCLKMQKRLPFDQYMLNKASCIMTGRQIVKSSVHEESGFLGVGRILNDGKSIYDTTLSMTDLSTGVNK